ncbi:MAG: ribonuclease HII [Oscillospiraceae bacterium]|nr:ribonuclease HII [Oscillospiraceae bacterium]
MSELWTIEKELFEKGIALVCGCDEAGAGPLAGPVCAGAVILRPFEEIEGLNDSKKLTEKKRDALYDVITARAVAWSAAMVDEKTIDEINILNARMLAMERAINGLRVRPDFALIDGNRNKGITCPNQMVVKGDSRSASIAAASIIAKVTRDRYMLEMAEKYPQYAFEKHKGYGTKLHYERIIAHGPSPIHRLTFLKNLEEHR